MPSPTTNFQAGIESNAVQISYGREATWATMPAVAFQAIRLMSESLAGSKSRDRPGEIRTDLQVSHAITKEVTAGGAINFALSYGTYDDLIASMLMADWSTPLSIAGVAGDITITAVTNVLSSTTAGKFTTVSQGQWIKLAGFTNAANNGIFYVQTKTDATHLVLTPGSAAFVTETPAGTAASISGSMIRNGTSFISFFIEKMLSSALFLNYAGSYVSQMTLQAQQGQFAQGSFTLIAQSEAKATSESSTGAVVAAPTGRVIDTVTGFQSLAQGGSAIAAVCKGVELQLQKQGSAGEYGVGSAAAQGMLRGTMQVSGKLTLYFKDFTIYNLFVSEADTSLSWRHVDNAGNTYVVTLPTVTLMNPKIVAGGPNQPVMAEFEIEGNPDSVTGCTVQLDKFAGP